MKRLWVVGGFCAGLFITTTASAAPTESRLQLSLAGQFVGYERLSISGLTTSTTGFGLATPSVGVGVAGGIGKNFVLGGRLAFATQNSSPEGGDSVSQTQVAVSLIPEYVFDGDAIRPFLSATFGYDHVSADAGATQRAGVSGGTAVAGGGIGVHCFATDSFSIDPSVSLLYEGGTIAFNSDSHDVSGFAVMGTIAFSGWLGHGPKENGASNAD